jgi:hypothetical protein
MIRLKERSSQDGTVNRIVFDANEPTTLTINQSESGHLVAYAYQGMKDQIDENTEPVVVFDSDADPKTRYVVGSYNNASLLESNLRLHFRSISISLMDLMEGKEKYNWKDDKFLEELNREYAFRKRLLMRELSDGLGSLTVSELKALGFKKWGAEGDIYLIPTWIYDLLPDGIELESVDGKKAIKGKEGPDFNYIAYGVSLETLRRASE